MNTPPRKIPESEIVTGSELNPVIDYIREISVTGGRGIKVDRKVTGTFLTAEIPKASIATPGAVRAYVLVTVNNDTYTCDDLETLNRVTIAKPLRLRLTGWDGETVSLNDGNGSDYQAVFTFISEVKRRIQIGALSEIQVIVPGYKPGLDLIFASASENGTGISGVDLIDLNVEGRAWARSRVQS